jgi:hypothetical protein
MFYGIIDLRFGSALRSAVCNLQSAICNLQSVVPRCHMRKETVTVVMMLLLLSCALAFALGLVLAGNWGASPEFQRAMESLRLDTAAKMSWIRIGFWGGLAAVAVVGLGGAVAGLLRATWRRSRLIRPETSGLFPIVEGRAGGRILRPGSGYTYFHDPNRQWAGTTAYGAGPEGPVVRHLAPPGQEEAQLQIASQAQATQFVAAASRGGGLNASARRLVEKVALASPARPPPSLPEVVVLSEAVPEERRLLAALRQDWEEGEE